MTQKKRIVVILGVGALLIGALALSLPEASSCAELSLWLILLYREIVGATTMQAVLKGLFSDDIADLEKYVPPEDDKFGFILRAMVGPMNGEGEESFDIGICTPKWLTEKHRTSEILLGLHKLIVFEYDYFRIRRFIEKYLMRCSGETWAETAQKVSLLGQWEFEGYQSRPPQN